MGHTVWQHGSQKVPYGCHERHLFECKFYAPFPGWSCLPPLCQWLTQQLPKYLRINFTYRQHKVSLTAGRVWVRFTQPVLGVWKGFLKEAFGICLVWLLGTNPLSRVMKSNDNLNYFLENESLIYSWLCLGSDHDSMDAPLLRNHFVHSFCDPIDCSCYSAVDAGIARFSTALTPGNHSDQHAVANQRSSRVTLKCKFYRFVDSS